jgi:YHS domain-containing protein
MNRIVYVMGLMLVVSAGQAVAADPIHTGWLSDKAVDGYDVVAYFDQGEPVEGSPEHSLQWKGAEWRFASAEHLERFRANPEKYAPQYGGYCAWAVAQNKTAAGDPHQWSIVDGKLYLNYNADIQQKWAANKVELIEQADRNWPGVLDR